MVNLAIMFERIAKGPILGVVIGWDARELRSNRGNFEQYGKLITWNLARPILDYEYDSGYGGADCHAVYAWTETQVIFVTEYDGSTSLAEVPRNPTPCKPNFNGN